MITLVVLGLLTFLLLPIILLVSVIRLNSHLAELETRIQAMRAEMAGHMPQKDPPREDVRYSPATITPVPSAPPPGQATTPRPAPQDDIFIAWLKENWLLKLGALLILLAFGWFVTYAFMNNWIGPAGRIALGLIGGSAILALGAWRMRAYATQGAVFVSLGATGILLTVFAGRVLYGFFTPLSALALMFATSALIAFVSGIYGRKQLAVVSLILAGLAPYLADASHDHLATFCYLLVVVIGAVWIVLWKDFREVVLAALIMVLLHSIPLLTRTESVDVGTFLLFGYAFAAIFYLVNTAGLMRLAGAAAQSDLVTAALNALLLLAWIYVGAAPEWQSLIVSAWAVAFVLGASILYRATGRKEPLYLYAAIGVAYIAAATAIELSGPALTIAYTIESAIVVGMLYATRRDVLASLRTSWLLAGPALLSLGSIVAPEWHTSVFNDHFFVLSILSAVFFVLAALFWKETRSLSDEARSLNAGLVVGGSLYAFVTLWLSLHAALPASPDTAAMIALVAYALVGVCVYAYGLATDGKGFRTYGGTLVGLVAFRLLLVDVWQMALTGRIVTFSLIGALLMSTAFFGRGSKHATTPSSTPRV